MGKAKARTDGHPNWPYGLAGMAVGFVCTLLYVQQELRPPASPHAMAPAADQIRIPATPLPPNVRSVATNAPAVSAAVGIEPDPSPMELPVVDTPGNRSDAAPPPYPSPLMPCRRLGDPVAQARAGPDGPPGYRCRLLNPAAARG